MSIYTNPATDQVHIGIENQPSTAQYEVFNSLGIKMIEGSIQDETILRDVSTFTKGIYFIKIAYQDQNIIRKALIE